MNWLKDAIIDIAVTLVIVAYAIWRPEWAWWVIVIYTPLMLLLKLSALSSPVRALSGKAKVTVPGWFYHVLYAVNVVALLVAEWWIVAAGWVLIWVLSMIAESKSKAAVKPKAKVNPRAR